MATAAKRQNRTTVATTRQNIGEEKDYGGEAWIMFQTIQVFLHSLDKTIFPVKLFNRLGDKRKIRTYYPCTRYSRKRTFFFFNFSRYVDVLLSARKESS